MANVSERLRAAGRVLAGKPQVLTEAAKLRKLLVEVEADIGRKERELGRLVFTLRQEGREDGGRVDALCAEIRALFDRRAELHRRLVLSRIKDDVLPCPACGEPVLPGSRFCGGCGRQLAHGVAAESAVAE